MKGFRSGASASLLALAYFAAHLPFLAPSLEDIDSINFALGLREFDVGSHQPHPPGYPVYITLGRMSLALISLAAPGLDAVRAEALALSVWSALAGGIAVAAAWSLFSAFDGSRRAAAWAAALLAVAPLFWTAGLRPMSDLPGLAAALCALALIVRGIARPRLLLAGAFVAGLAGGIRSQALVLTLPLLAAAPILARHEGTAARDVVRRAAGAAAAFAAGILVWAVPMVVVSGGVPAYVAALGTQAGEDFAWVDMLWSNPTPRRLALSLYETFALPWSLTALAIAVLALAAAGGAASVVRGSRPAVLLGLAFGPYAIFHLLLQETVTVRYALPVLPAVSWLAVRGAFAIARRGGAIACAALVAWALVVSWPAGAAYGRDMHPAFRAIADMEKAAGEAAAAGAGRPAAIHSHYSLRRPLQARAPRGVPVVEAARQGEPFALADYWLRGNLQPIWFLADPRRTDLEGIDPRSRHAIAYRWSVGDRAEFSGTRPMGADWYRLDPPGWFAGEGWSLTPEMAGVARASGAGLDGGPIHAYVRRGRGPLHLVVGGGYIDPPASGSGSPAAGNPAARVDFEMSIEGATVARWELSPGGSGRFVKFVTLPGGVPAEGTGYAALTVSARASEGGGPIPPVAIRQFDVQPAARPIWAFGEGWHDEEYENATGRRWRWTSGRALIHVSPPGSGVRLRLTGESPRRYFDAAPHVRVTAGDAIVAEFDPDEDFDWEVSIGADALAAAGGAIAIETDRVYRPGDAEGTADSRSLGLRLFTIAVHPVLP